MIIDLFRCLWHGNMRRKQREAKVEATIATSPNVTRLPIAPKAKDPLVTELVEDWLQNGIPTTDVDHHADALVYMVFDRLLVLLSQETETYLDQMLQTGFDRRILRAMSEYFPYAHDDLLQSLTDKDRYGLRDYIPLYILQRRNADMAPRFVKNAKEWLITHGEAYKASHSGEGSGISIRAVWLSNESSPKEDFKFKEWLHAKHRDLYHLERVRKDPLYGGRPHEVLTAPRPELERSFSWWALELSLVLDPKYRNKSDYRATARAIGKKIRPLMANAQDQVLIEAERRYQAWSNRASSSPSYESILACERRYSLDKNQGLARYVRLLSEEGDFEEAISICSDCLRFGIHDGTKGGFAARKATLERKLKRNRKAV